MPRVVFNEETIEVPVGANLRRALIRAGAPPYNGAARFVNCRGLGTCGTCAVEIVGEVSPPTRRETWRLAFPPHRPGSGLRLACQCRVLGDVIVSKRRGFWGQQAAPR